MRIGNVGDRETGEESLTGSISLEGCFDSQISPGYTYQNFYARSFPCCLPICGSEEQLFIYVVSCHPQSLI